LNLSTEQTAIVASVPELAAVALVVLVLHPEAHIAILHPSLGLKVLKLGHLPVILVGEEEAARDFALVDDEPALLPVQLDAQHLLPVLLGVQEPDDGHVVTAVLGLVVGTCQISTQECGG